MTRCQTTYLPIRGMLRTKLRKHLYTSALLCATLPAIAQTLPAYPILQASPPALGIRPFPANAQLGILQVLQPPVILLNEKYEQLSPGSRIRGANNMLVMSGALVGQNLLVKYVREPHGLIHEVWILNPAEVQLFAPNTIE